MSITVVGSIAYDGVKTPAGERERMLGGAATHFAQSASLFDEVRVIGPVGDDFDDASWEVLRTRGVNTDDVEHVAGGKTFFWKGEYHEGFNTRDTITTELNVFEHFDPKVSAAAAEADVLFLANIHPALQTQVLDQVPSARFTALDSMNLWIDIAREDLEKVIKRVDVLILNDEELLQLTEARSLPAAAQSILGWGLQAVVAKLGSHGAQLFTKEGSFSLPAYPIEQVVDPTGAGDTFAGGFVGYVAATLGIGAPITDDVLRNAMAYGTAAASHNVEAFGTERTVSLTGADVRARVSELERMTRFTDRPVELRA